ncbi:MAG: CoB--CoM heterodisulfide reductase subunit B [Candidatus Atabeyarchaeum deiterrae]|jgi:heterodisulfide reductase subunit B
MTEYALFLGCMIPLRLPNLEAAARRVLEALDVKLIDMKEASCCPDPEAIQSLDYATWLSLAARNLSIAEDMGRNILTLCNGCFETLKTANETLKNNGKLKERVNAVLGKIGRSFKGSIDVKHLIEVLYKEVGVRKIRENVVTSLTGINVATHYGCHVLRPSSILKVDDPEEPHILDDLVEATGARSIPYMRKMLCCGAAVRSMNKDESLDLTYEKIEKAKRSGADCLLTICPTCFLQYDTGQIELRGSKKVDSNLPVVYLPELLGIAFGMNSDELGLGTHKVKTKNLIDKMFLLLPNE